MTNATVQNRAQLHHYVPRLHLRLFAAHGGRTSVYEHDKRTDRTRLRPIKRAGARRDFYTIELEEGKPTDAFERSFHPIENAAAVVLHKFQAARVGPLRTTDADREALAAYVALEYSRVPGHVDQTAQVSQYLTSITADMSLANAGRYRETMRKAGSEKSDDELEADRLLMIEQLRSGAIEVRHPYAGLLGIGPALEALPPIVAAMNWTVLEVAAPPFLVMGDSPVLLFHPDPPLLCGVGFASEGVEVHMAISPTRLFVATAKSHSLSEQVGRQTNRLVVTDMNRRSWVNASEHVYGHTAEALAAAREATPKEDRLYEPAVAPIFGGPPQWEVYKPKPQPPDETNPDDAEGGGP